MPRPIRNPGQRYMPGLDGLRAIAVLAVIASHLGVPGAAGGLLGVGMFFTLSGYLITDLLLGRFARTGTLGMRTFWLSRARRLLPALLVMLAIVAAVITVAHRSALAGLRGSVLSSAGFVGNWWLITQHVSYFARFAPPSPLGHLWSLAVEEQFYLVWPWLLLAGLALVRRRIRRRPEAPRYPELAAAALVLAAVSAFAMAALYHPGFDNTRAYEGTDTRAFGLLIGAALAMVWPSRQLPRMTSTRVRSLLDAIGVIALAVVAALIVSTDEYSAFLYRGGLVVLSVATALVVAVAAHPASRTGRALGWSPLRWIGVRSYGIYLWHLPIIVLASRAAQTGPMDWTRAALQLVAVFGLAALSWRYVEQPIRHGALGRAWRRGRLLRIPRGWGWAVPTAAVAVLTTACVGLSSSDRSASPSAASTTPTHVTIHLTPPPAASSAPAASSHAGASSHPAASSLSPSSTPPRSTVRPPAAPQVSTAASRTSCTTVTHLGDSTSDGLVSPDYLPNPADRIDAQYARVGVSTVHLEISGGTSILETAQAGETNVYEVTRQLLSQGVRGCWVLALGTNDTADVVVGSALDRAGRIAKMMNLLAGQPVLWITAKTLLNTGPYAEAGMQTWNSILLRSCASYPTMRVYDWAGAVQNSWFIDDGIHYTSIGYAHRARLIADALTHAFPSTGTSSSCLVH